MPSVANPDASSASSGAHEMRPRLGFSPTSPQQEAGMRIEPPPSLAWAMPTIPAATAAALPPEEPPGVRSRFQGLWAAPKRSGSVTGRMPSSGQLVLPTTIAPAARRRRTTAESCVGIQSSSAAMPTVVRTPSVIEPRSLISTGTPASGRSSPEP